MSSGRPKKIILKEERSSEEEEVVTQPPDLKQQQPDTLEQKLVKRNEQAKSPALGQTKPPIPPRPAWLLKPKKDDIPTPQVQPQGTGSKLEEDLGSFALDGQKWELKIDYQKLVVAANRGPEKVALKISPDQGHCLQENVVAATWIKILDINGVTAPEMHLLSDNDIARVLDAAKLKDATKTAKVIQAVGRTKAAKSSDVFTAGTISQLVPESVANYQIGLELGETTLKPPKSPDQAIEEINELLKLLIAKDTGQGTRFLESLDKEEYDKCLVTWGPTNQTLVLDFCWIRITVGWANLYLLQRKRWSGLFHQQPLVIWQKPCK
jgi:hypothetical protein